MEEKEEKDPDGTVDSVVIRRPPPPNMVQKLKDKTSAPTFATIFGSTDIRERRKAKREILQMTVKPQNEKGQESMARKTTNPGVIENNEPGWERSKERREDPEVCNVPSPTRTTNTTNLVVVTPVAMKMKGGMEERRGSLPGTRKMQPRLKSALKRSMANWVGRCPTRLSPQLRPSPPGPKPTPDSGAGAARSQQDVHEDFKCVDESEGPEIESLLEES